MGVVTFATGSTDVPVGTVIFSATAVVLSGNDIVNIPKGYLYCDHSAYSVETYPSLGNALGDTYLTEADKLNPEFIKEGNLLKFRVPDLRDVFIRGYGNNYHNEEPSGKENPQSLGWYELDNGSYVLTTDTTINKDKIYYTKREFGTNESDQVGKFTYSGTTDDTTATGSITIDDNGKHSHNIDVKTKTNIQYSNAGGVTGLVISNEPKYDGDSNLNADVDGLHNHSGSVTLDSHNHTFTVVRKEYETRPKNITLLPLIKY